MAEVVHKLGVVGLVGPISGTLWEDTDAGTVKYVPSGKFLSVFCVRVSDVTGVSSEKKGWFTVLMKIHGQGTVLAEAEVHSHVPADMDAWFKSRNGLGATRTTQVPSSVGELANLAELHRSGALTDEEFAAAKRTLLGLK